MRLSPEHSMNPCNTGRIHSIETFGTVDGPGLRFVVFFQGCPMRCLYCHNPDTWESAGGIKMTVSELIEAFDKNKTFYKTGGITATGGEPLLQLPFLTSLFQEAKRRGIHTCLDTSGIMYSDNKKAAFEKLFSYTDLVMLDIKTTDPVLHKKLTGCPFEPVLHFAHALEDMNIPLRIRHVIVPDLTYDKDKLFHIGLTIGNLKNLKELEILPYHTMGEKKYEALGINYPLKGTDALSKEDTLYAKHIILTGIKKSQQ